MDWWVPLTEADVALVFNEQERDALRMRDAGESVLASTLGDMVAIVREAVAQNRSNRLSSDPELIPRSLRPAAVDIVALRLLKRFALTVTEPRKLAAEKAEELLEAVRDGDYDVIDEEGEVESAPADTPAILAPRRAYGCDGVGWYPTPPPPYVRH